MKKNKTFQALFSFPGFKAKGYLQGKFGDHKARIVELKRQKKRLYVLVVESVIRFFMIVRFVKHEIWMLRIIDYMYVMKGVVFRVQGAVCV